MPATVFGVGIGLFLILTLWVLAIIIFLISLRIEKKVGVIAILIVTVVTVILISVPRASEKPGISKKKPYDHLFVWRVILVTLLALSSTTGLIAYIKSGLVEPIRPTRIVGWVF